MTTQVFLVDAFTSQRFRGNPAGVCLVDAKEFVDADWMQSVAAELNQTETAFIWPKPDGAFAIRWFTPTREEELCGHATLASAHVLWEVGVLQVDISARFESRSGVLSARRAQGGVELDFPSEPATQTMSPDDVVAALGCRATDYARSRLDHIVFLEDEQAVRDVTPDMAALVKVPGRGVVVTANGSSGPADFVSRYFSPKDGIAEDPVTGSAHCTLGPLWAARLGRAELVGHQLSARGGVVKVRVAGDRVFLIGEAITVLRGGLI